MLRLCSYLLRLLTDVPDADVCVRWRAFASVAAFAAIRAFSSSDYVALRVAFWAGGSEEMSGDALVKLLVAMGFVKTFDGEGSGRGGGEGEGEGAIDGDVFVEW